MSTPDLSDHLIQHLLAEIRRLRAAGTPASHADIVVACCYALASSIAKEPTVEGRASLIRAATENMTQATDLLVTVRTMMAGEPT